MVSDGLRAALASRGLHIEQNDTTGEERPFAVSGDTYPVREAIKSAGGRWSRREQCWRLAGVEEVEQLARLLGETIPAREAPARETTATPATSGARSGEEASSVSAMTRFTRWFTGKEPASGGAGQQSAPGLADARAEFDSARPIDVKPPPRRDKVPKAPYGSKHYHGHRARLRQRVVEMGPEALADYELLELILFFSVWRRDTKPLAKELIEQFGGLGAVLSAEPSRLAEHFPKPVEGESENQDLLFTRVLFQAMKDYFERVLKEEIKERPVIGSWTALLNYLQMVMTHEPAEHFRILFLDRKNILLKDEVQSRGTVDHTPLYPREVVKRALELAASSLIMVHNHPSGDPTPSQADIDMTNRVIAALQPVSITVHDHVIIGKNRHLSFKSQNLI